MSRARRAALRPFTRCGSGAARFRASNAGYGYGHAKQELFEALMDEFGPARKRREELAADLGEVEAILKKGAEKVRPVVEDTMDRVRRATGLR